MDAITAAEMKKADKAAIEEFGIPSLLLMENAGRGAAKIALDDFLKKGQKAVCICGKGNNGGDGFVCTRHLINQGINVDIFLIGDEFGLKKDAKVNFQILKKMDADIYQLNSENNFSFFQDKIKDAELIIDAIFGIGISGKIREPYFGIIETINKAERKVLALDVPSGLEATEGVPLGTCIRADKTVTFAAPKTGIVQNQGPHFCGEVIVVDISIPKELLN